MDSTTKKCEDENCNDPAHEHCDHENCNHDHHHHDHHNHHEHNHDTFRIFKLYLKSMKRFLLAHHPECDDFVII